MQIIIENIWQSPWQSPWQSSLAKTWQSSVWQTSILGDAPPRLNCEGVVRRDPRLFRYQLQGVVPDPSGKVLAKLRGKGQAKLNGKTPGKAVWQNILARPAKLQSAQTSAVSCGKSLFMQGIVPAAKISWHLHYVGAGKARRPRSHGGQHRHLGNRKDFGEKHSTILLVPLKCPRTGGSDPRILSDTPASAREY